MTGSFGEMGNLLKQAQKMQRAMQEAREELSGLTAEGTAGGGVVKVTVSGEGQVEKIEISDEVAKTADRSLLEELVLAACRDAITKAHRMRDERLAKVTGGLQLPGIP